MSGGATERTSGARALLYSVLGEFVLPHDGAAWTSTLVAACGLCDIAEKNARQALARLGEQGRIEPRRHGRQVRWHLTPSGTELLRAGARRIYDFGAHSGDWDGEWLVAHCPVPETRRALRLKLRTRLAFEGFGELSASLAVSPNAEREPALRAIIADLGFGDEFLVWRSRTATATEDAQLAARAWDLDALAGSYNEFIAQFAWRRPIDDATTFAAMVELVHDWRRFPFIDPELPLRLLPPNWAGLAATELFRERRREWSDGAHRWFGEHEAKSEMR